MLVEDHQQGKVVACLICRTSIKVGAAAPPSPSSIRTPVPKK